MCFLTQPTTAPFTLDILVTLPSVTALVHPSTRHSFSVESTMVTIMRRAGTTLILSIDHPDTTNTQCNTHIAREVSDIDIITEWLKVQGYEGSFAIG